MLNSVYTVESLCLITPLSARRSRKIVGCSSYHRPTRSRRARGERGGAEEVCRRLDGSIASLARTLIIGGGVWTPAYGAERRIVGRAPTGRLRTAIGAGRDRKRRRRRNGIRACSHGLAGAAFADRTHGPRGEATASPAQGPGSRRGVNVTRGRLPCPVFQLRVSLSASAALRMCRIPRVLRHSWSDENEGGCHSAAVAFGGRRGRGSCSAGLAAQLPDGAPGGPAVCVLAHERTRACACIMHRMELW